MIRNKKGETLLIVIVFLFVVTSLSLALVSYTQNRRLVTQHSYTVSRSMNVAEAGVNKALWCLNHSTQCPNPYTGETANAGDGQYTTTVTSTGLNYTVTSVGTVSNVIKTIKANISQTSTPVNASFFYGVQVGVGGVDMENGSQITGNIYAMGLVQATQNQSQTTITGDAILTLSSPTQDVSCSPSVSPLNTLDIGSASGTRYLAQSFIPNVTDKIYSIDLKIAKHSSPTTTIKIYIYTDNSNNPGTNISGSGQQINATVPNDTPAGWENGWTNQVFTPATNPILQSGIKYWLVLVVSGNDASKYWHVVRAADDSTYPNNTARLDSDTTAMPLACAGGCDIAFRTNMGGLTPTLKVGTVGGSAYAHTINDVTVGNKAYYDDLVGTVKANNGAVTCQEGNNGPWCFNNSPDQPQQNMPISSAQISQMEADATGGGTEPTNCNINGGTIGPKEYDCDVTINGTVTLNGTVWVNGNLTFAIGAILKLSTGYASNSGVVIADYITDPTTKGKVYFDNNGDLQGNGTAGTYIMIISTYKDPTDINSAIDIRNNMAAGVLYAPYGKVSINNGSSLKEVTAQKLFLSQNASIAYESGLASVIFTNGPGGAWVIKSKTWQELN